MLTLQLENEAATIRLGAALAAAFEDLPEGLVVYLQGDLGVGKTTLCRGLLQALGHPGAVKSPTYTLVESYTPGALTLHHFDLYRLHDPEELEFMGIRDYFGPDTVALVEWPQRGGGHFPPADLQLALALAGDGRTAALTAVSPRGQELVERLKTALKY
ncbi:MAG: tRNA (adenosine(37)-N6)-threonylcarbamoyltransferase complex ATPase subunit type 1 TsaE [Spongiibacteraceae bacterium]